jgi:hypothetical protein
MVNLIIQRTPSNFPFKGLIWRYISRKSKPSTYIPSSKKLSGVEEDDDRQDLDREQEEEQGEDGEPKEDHWEAREDKKEDEHIKLKKGKILTHN